MNHIISIQIWQLVSAYIFILILIGVVRFRKISREKEILIATIRMTIQLMIVGYLLSYIFKHPNPFITLIIIAIMETFAIYNIYRRVKADIPSKLKTAVGISLVTGTLISLFYFDFVVIRFDPWFDPRYFISIAGMIIGNAMTGITLGLNALIEGMKSKRHLVEAALMMGATPKVAAKEITNHSFDTAIMPTINNMVGMGIVFLPGMMTGVILSGINPVVAIKYQVAIMIGIVGSVSLSVMLFVFFGYKAFFNERDQLIRH